MNRKLFLKAASVLAVSSMKGLPALYAATEEVKSASIPIIDTHQHLVDFKRFGQNWSRPPVPGNYGMEEYLQATEGLNFVKAVYMEVAVPAERRHEEALYALELCKDQSNPTVAAVIKADVYSSDFQNYMLQFKDSPYIKGIRGSFGDPKALTGNLLIENVRALGEMNMSLDFSVLPASLPAMLGLVRSCPGTRFLINHCGNVDPRAFLDPALGYGKADHDGRQLQNRM
jgi:L-fuconolactonase